MYKFFASFAPSAVKKLPVQLLLLAMLFTGAAMAQAHGGGTPQLVNATAGPYRVTVWTQPAPLTTGETHLTVAVTEPPAAGTGTGESGPPVLNASVTLTFSPLSGSAAPFTAQATHESAVNKLLYETDLHLPAAGRWQVDIEVTGAEGSGHTNFQLEVLPPARSPWPFWGSVGLLGLALVWGGRARQRGAGWRRVIPVVALAGLTVALTGGWLALTEATPARASIQRWGLDWPFGDTVDPLLVEVTGRQWEWQFTYPASGQTSAALVLPANQPVRLRLTAEDVVHSFAVPEFGLNEALQPGRVIELQLTPTEPGTYLATCEAFCGLSFDEMLAEVIVLPPTEFEAWLTAAE